MLCMDDDICICMMSNRSNIIYMYAKGVWRVCARSRMIFTFSLFHIHSHKPKTLAPYAATHIHTRDFRLVFTFLGRARDFMGNHALQNELKFLIQIR